MKSSLILILFLTVFIGAVAYPAGRAEPEPEWLFYDEDAAKRVSDYEGTGDQLAVKFTNPNYPDYACILSTVSIICEGAGDVEVHVWRDVAGKPGTDLITPFTVTMVGDLSREEFDLSEPVGITAQNFHVGYELLQDAPPHPVKDGESTVEDRSRARHADGSWTGFLGFGNLNIRAFVSYYELEPELIAYDGPPFLRLTDYENTGDRVAVRFTNTNFPESSIQLDSLAIANEGTGDVEIHVWHDFNGNPGGDLITPFTAMLNWVGEFQIIPLLEPVEIHFSDFHVGWEFIQDAPPYAVTDNDGNTEDRSKGKAPSGNWEVLNHDLNIRAWVTYIPNNSFFLIDYHPEDFVFSVPVDSTVSTRTFNIISYDASGYVKSLCDSNWVYLEPDSVELNSGDSVEIEVTFDPSGLDTSTTYSTEIYFESDVPIIGFLPVVMTVLPAYKRFSLIYATDDFIFDVQGDSLIYRTFSLVAVDTSGYVQMMCDSSWVSFDPDWVEMFAGDTVVVSAIFDPWGLDYDKTYQTEIYFDSDIYGLENSSIPVVMTTILPIPITIAMIPDDPPVTVPSGGSFTYQGILHNNIGGPFPLVTDVWINLEYRGLMFGPIMHISNIKVPPQGIQSSLIQHVHPQASPGEYTYIAYCGPVYPEIMDSTFFNFTVIEGPGDSNCGWEVYGWVVGEVIPIEYTLFQNFPNPFNPTTEIRYDLPQESNVQIDIYNLMGQRVETLTDGLHPAGEHSVTWNASHVASGIYFYRLVAGDKVFTKRMTLLK